MELSSLYSDVQIPSDVSFSEFLMEKIKSHGDDTALIDSKTGERVSYADLHGQVVSLTHTLLRRGVHKDQVVLFCGANCLLYPVCLLATTATGAIVTAVNPNYTADELAHQIADCQPSLIVADGAVLDKIHLALDKAACSTCQEVLTFDEVTGWTSVRHLLEETQTQNALPNVSISPGEDVLFLMYSSGTTGRPKGVMLTHHNVIANICQVNSHRSICMSPKSKDVIIDFVPMYHVFGMCSMMSLGLYRGDTIIIMAKYNLMDYLLAIQTHKVGILHLVPPIAVQLAKDASVRDYDLSSVHTLYCGAAPLSAQVEREAMQATGVQVFRQGYGLTELSPVCHIAPVTGWKHGSCGQLIPNTECKVIDSEGMALGPMLDGEVCVRGPQVMKGYWGKPEATSQMIDYNGWLHTGDIGHYDSEGHFYIVDRLKELIKWKGLQVAPADLEAVLLEHPAVADAGVIGVPDVEAGELPKAYVVCKPGMSVTEKELIDYVSKRVSPHKRLRGGIEFISEIPKTISGKILRKVLKKMALDFSVKL